MSGICGICENGRVFSGSASVPMLEAMSLSTDSEQERFGGPGVALGIARRWDSQRLACLSGVKVVADTDLLELSSLRKLVPGNDGLNPAELIACLYLQQGDQFLEALNGAFSLALWDERKHRLLLAIDRIGIRSLVWRREGDRLYFASRIGAIRAVQSEPVAVAPKALVNYLLFASVPAPLAIDAGSQKLRPGTYLTFEAGRLAEHQYWDVAYQKGSVKSEAEWADELRETMRAAVHRHLDQCAPGRTGCYLSGGTDSSSVVAFSSEVHHPTKSFSIIFEETGFSEIDFARTAAERFQTVHHEMSLRPADASAAIDKIIQYYDEPFANSSAIGSYYCAELARRNGVDVLLAGDGGDELFGGNERYAADKRFALYHSLPGWLRRSVIEPIVRALPDSDSAISLPRRYVRRASIPNPRRILSYGFFLSMPPEQIFEEDFLRELRQEDWLAVPEAHFRRTNAQSELDKILYLDLKMTLADNDLRKVSGTAELAGVNVRYPLLDRRLVELSGRIPASLKLKGFEKRYIFKRAMKGILPDKILYKKKHGFGVPLAQWLLHESRMAVLLQDVMGDALTRQRGYFRPAFLSQLMVLHQRQPNYYGEIVWYLVALELWHRQHLHGARQTVSC